MTGGTEALRQERDELAAARRAMAARLGGEDPTDVDPGDGGDQSQQLEGDDDLARLDRRIAEIDHQLADPDRPADGPVVTLRFPDGGTATYHVVAVAGSADDAVTADSPLGQALAGCRAGETVTWATPDGEASAEVVDVHEP